MVINDTETACQQTDWKSGWKERAMLREYSYTALSKFVGCIDSWVFTTHTNTQFCGGYSCYYCHSVDLDLEVVQSVLTVEV